jgi:PTH1 family peptidyl-tRNA hydrolase
MTKLIVGLGNPGPRYAHTRHNVGFSVIAELGRRYGLSAGSRGNAIIGEGTIGSQRVVLAQPTTMMNDSGRAVAPLRKKHGVWELEDLLVVYDELDLPLGTVRIRARGSAGGHNGMKSIIQAVGGQDFPRVRVGIGRPPGGSDPIEHVLARFKPDEKPVIEQAIATAADAIESWIALGTDETMNRFNGGPGGAGTSPDDRRATASGEAADGRANGAPAKNDGTGRPAEQRRPGASLPQSSSTPEPAP